MGQTNAIDLDRPRDVWEILRAALGLYRRYPLLFLLLALAVVAPYELIELAITGQGWLSSAPRALARTIPLDLVQVALVGPLIAALDIHAVVAIGEGQPPRLSRVGLQGLRVLPVVVAAQIVAFVGITLGLLAFVIPGILLALRWAVVAQAAALEHEGWEPALRRSWKLTSGLYWHILGLLLVTGVINGVIKLAASAIAVGTPSTLSTASNAAKGSDPGTVILGIAVYTITASFSALTLALLYFDLRARQAPASAGEEPGSP